MLIDDLIDYLSDVYDFTVNVVIDEETHIQMIELDVVELNGLLVFDDIIEVELKIEDIINHLQERYDFYFDYYMICGFVYLIPLI